LAREEDEFPVGTVRRVADVVHFVSMLDERGLDLGALAETQGRVGRQRFPIAEYPCPSEAHQRQAYIGGFDPALNRTDAIYVGDPIGRLTGPLLSHLSGRVPGLKHEAVRGRTPLGRVSVSEDVVAKAVLLLGSPAKGNIIGAYLPVAGGID